MKVLIAGEGPNELGSFSYPEHYRPKTEQRGTISALIDKFGSSQPLITDGIYWKKIKKYKSQDRNKPEERSIMGLTQYAKEHKFDAVIFLRDQDGNKQRQQEIQKALKNIKNKFPNSPIVIGGIPTICLEAWLLALNGITNSFNLSKNQLQIELEKKNIRHKNTEDYVKWIDQCKIENMAKDSTSLIKFKEELETLFDCSKSHIT